jgi:hypothetical protein
VYGVIFLFKYPTGETRSDTPKDGTFDYDAAENLFFAAQTIQNACGTQALLSVLLNKTDELDIGPSLTEFKEFTSAFPSDVSIDRIISKHGSTELIFHTSSAATLSRTQTSSVMSTTLSPAPPPSLTRRNAPPQKTTTSTTSLP